MWIRYNRTKTVRLHPNGKVERKYINKNSLVWRTVDYQTLTKTDQPRHCPKGYRTRLIRTAV